MQLFQNGSPNTPTFPAKRALVGAPGYANSGPPGVVASTKLDPDVVNTILAEFVAILTAAGLSPDPTNNAQLLAALAILYGRLASNNTWTGTNAFTPGISAFEVIAPTSASLYLGSDVYVAAVNRANTAYAQMYVANATNSQAAVNLGQFHFTNVSLDTSWSIRPDGLIEQCYQTGAAVVNGISSTNNAIPIAFPNAIIDCTICFYGTVPPIPGNIAVQPYDRANVTITTNGVASGTFGCIVRCRGY